MTVMTACDTSCSVIHFDGTNVTNVPQTVAQASTLLPMPIAQPAQHSSRAPAEQKQAVGGMPCATPSQQCHDVNKSTSMRTDSTEYKHVSTPISSATSAHSSAPPPMNNNIKRIKASTHGATIWQQRPVKQADDSQTIHQPMMHSTTFNQQALRCYTQQTMCYPTDKQTLPHTLNTLPRHLPTASHDAGISSIISGVISGHHHICLSQRASWLRALQQQPPHPPTAISSSQPPDSARWLVPLQRQAVPSPSSPSSQISHLQPGVPPLG
jgi:hypothetical protein